MKVKSKYKNNIIKKKKESKQQPKNKKNDNKIKLKDTSKIDDILPSKILIDEPKNIFQKSKVFKYEIEKNLETSLQNISSNINHVFVCIYYVISNRTRINIEYPFILYLLYKFKKQNKRFSDTLVFPFVKHKKNKNHQNEADELVKNLTGSKLKTKGFIEMNSNIYFFYDYGVLSKTIRHISNKKSYENLWWSLIDEICNHKKVIYFPIHKSVWSLFLNYSNLIFLKDKEGSNIEIPIVSYYGDYYKLLPIISTLGQNLANNRGYGDYYYLTTFKKAVRYACWTVNYAERIINDKVVTNENGMFKKGGVVRYATFMFKTFCQTKPMEVNKSKKWSEKYDSLYVGRSSKPDSSFISIEPKYVVKKFEQAIPLSYHLINQKNIPQVWDINFDYEIE
tara:strand:+ start:1688 stop:2869 length:1182 start_codon:yes stop_codon:yes gene_type:complete